MVSKIFWKQMVRDPTLHFIWRKSKQTLPSHIMLGISSMLTQREDCHQLSHQDRFLQLLCGPWGIQLGSGTDLVWPQRVLGAQHKEISMWATLLGAPSFMLSYVVPLQWVKGYERRKHGRYFPVWEDDFTAPSTDTLKQQLSCGAVHRESTKPMRRRSDGVSYGDALTQAARKSSEAFHPVFSVYTTSAPERRKTILGTVYGVFKNVIGTIFCIPLPVKPDDCTMS